MSDQAGIPVTVTPEEVAREKTLGGAIELCAKAAGYDLDKQLAFDMGVDKAQFSRWTNGTEGILWPKLRKLMSLCGNDAPVLWMLHQIGYDLHALRRRESELERRLRESEEALARERSERAAVEETFRRMMLGRPSP